MKQTLNSIIQKCCDCSRWQNLNNRGFFCYISLKSDCPMNPTGSTSKKKAINLIKEAIEAELIKRGLPLPQEA